MLLYYYALRADAACQRERAYAMLFTLRYMLFFRYTADI